MLGAVVPAPGNTLEPCCCGWVPVEPPKRFCEGFVVAGVVLVIAAIVVVAGGAVPSCLGA